jgi:hypothetical protein
MSETPSNRDLSGGQTDTTVLFKGRKVFGRFVLETKLGEGGAGQVWRARDEVIRQDVALKFPPNRLYDEARTTDQLRRETQKCKNLKNEYILRINDFYMEAGLSAISMELVDGPTFEKLLNDQPGGFFEPDALHKWLKQLCESLEYAHTRAKLVHHDLKPGNLMVNSDGDLRIADFGISRSIKDSQVRITGDVSSYTAHYACPQQLNGEPPSKLDDVYSAGATIYELVTGQTPFYHGDIAHQVRIKVPSKMSQRRRDLELSGAKPIPPEWDDAIAACLDKDPSKRPQSMAELAERLGLTPKPQVKVIVTPAPVLPPPPAPAPPPPPAGVSPWAWIAIAAAAIGLLVATFLFINSKPGTTRVIVDPKLVAEQKAAEERAQAAEAEKRRLEREKATADARSRAEEEARKKAEETAKSKTEEAQRLAREKAAIEADARQKSTAALAEAQQKLEEAQRQAREIEAKAKSEAEARAKAEAEARAKAVLAMQNANARGSVFVDTEPRGATVFLGADSQRSPATFKTVKVGKLPLKILLDGYATMDSEVEVREDATTDPGNGRPIKLSRLLGSIQILAATADVTYEIVNAGDEVAARGLAPGIVTNLPTGLYKVKLAREGWPEEKKEGVRVEKDSPASVMGVFPEGTIEVTSDPSGAIISVDGRSAGAARLKRVLSAGQHTLTAQYSNWPPVTQTITVRRNESQAVPIRIPHASLSISLVPEGAEFSLSLKSTLVGKWKASRKFDVLAPGEYTVTAAAEGYKSKTLTLTLANGDRKVQPLALESDPFFDIFRRVLAEMPRTTDPKSRGRALGELAAAQIKAGQSAAAQQSLAQAVQAVTDGIASAADRVETLAGIGLSLAQVGDKGASQQMFQRANQSLASVDAANREAAAMSLLLLHAEAGDVDNAVARRKETGWLEGDLIGGIIGVLAPSGQTDRIKRLMDMDVLMLEWSRAINTAAAALAQVRAGHNDEATRLFDKAQEAALQYKVDEKGKLPLALKKEQSERARQSAETTAQVAIYLHRANKTGLALDLLAKAREITKAIVSPHDSLRSAALEAVAQAYARCGDITTARDIAGGLVSSDLRAKLAVAEIESLIEANKLPAAQDRLGGVTEPLQRMYAARAVVHALARSGDLKGANSVTDSLPEGGTRVEACIGILRALTGR